MESILQNLFSSYFFFGVKLGHFTINNFFLYVTKTQAYQQKTKKFFVSEEKKFDRIDSWFSFLEESIVGEIESRNFCQAQCAGDFSLVADWLVKLTYALSCSSLHY